MRSTEASAFLQAFGFRLDPWDPDYSPATRLGPEPSQRVLDLRPEREDWQAMAPSAQRARPLILIDGRRRLDARVLGSLEGKPLYGAFATVAAGAVRLEGGSARFEALSVLRVVAMGAGQRPPAIEVPCPFQGRDRLLYDRGLTSPENDPDTPLALVQQAMLEEEAALARAAASRAEETLVMRDGPLRRATPEAIIGYVKTLHTDYLDGPASALLFRLKPGERTPLFGLDARAPEGRWSWYLRLPHAEPGGLSGLVRLELSSLVSRERAIELASWSAGALPALASHPARDPRAPQNLTPVGALERELGRRMGDESVIRRRLGHYLMKARTP